MLPSYIKFPLPQGHTQGIPLPLFQFQSSCEEAFWLLLKKSALILHQSLTSCNSITGLSWLVSCILRTKRNWFRTPSVNCFTARVNEMIHAYAKYSVRVWSHCLFLMLETWFGRVHSSSSTVAIRNYMNIIVKKQIVENSISLVLDHWTTTLEEPFQQIIHALMFNV